MSAARPMSFKAWLLRCAAVIILSACYGATLLVAALTPRPRPKRDADIDRILVFGTFHNPNWFFAHVLPLSQSGVDEVLLVADGHTADLPGVRLLVPPRWAQRLLTRAGAKFLWAFWYALKLRPNLYMGYAIFPAATSALVLGRLLQRPACFQVTSGPLELAGGGYHAENRILAALGTPSPWIERLAHALTRQFDLVVVRGSQGLEYVRKLGYTHATAVITGSIEVPAENAPLGARDIDLIFVGRLTERKRPERFVRVVAQIARERKNLRAVIVGDGPETAAIETQIATLGLQANIELLGLRKDVGALLARSKLFILTSRWEGVSIAMLEAMAAGTVPVVNNVGDLADVIREGVNGFLVPDGEEDPFAERALYLLNDDAAWQRCSQAAHETTVAECSRPAIARKWHATLEPLALNVARQASAGHEP